VDLRGQFSKHASHNVLDLAHAATAPARAGVSSIHAAPSGPKQLQIKDRIDAPVLAESFESGVTIGDLAATCGISESSVKRLLRRCKFNETEL
jgi:AraC-like DNA-binding protein